MDVLKTLYLTIFFAFIIKDKSFETKDTGEVFGAGFQAAQHIHDFNIIQ